MAETAASTELLDANGKPIILPHWHHFGMATTRNEAMVEWWHNVLGFRVVLRSRENPVPMMNFVTNDLAHHRGGFFSWPGMRAESLEEKQNHARIQHLAWEYDTIDELLSTWTRLKECGIEPVHSTCHGISFAFYYRDPDANSCELLADAYGDMAKSLEHMQREEMIMNPMGTQVDPAKLIEARESGVELDELRERALAGDYVPAKLDDPLLTW